MNETKDLVVTMTCDLQFGSDSVKNADAIKEALGCGFQILGADGQRMTLQYVNGHIFDKEGAALAGGVNPVALPVSKPAKILETPKREENAKDVVWCARCAKKKVRVDSKPCSQCEKRICTECKNYYTGLCRDCKSVKPQSAIHKSGRRPAPSYKKSIGVYPPPAAKAKALNKCEICLEIDASKKCLVCSKMICAGCYDRVNESCLKCAAVQ